jgi:hypothetical protein
MLSTLWISKPFSESEVNNVYVMLLFADSYQEIVRLDVPMKKVSRMNEFYSLEHLVSKHEHSFQ